MRPSSVWIMTTTSSTVSTVRRAVLNGVVSGTRSMASRMSVIFIVDSCPGARRSGADALDGGDAVDGRRVAAGHHRQDGGHHHAVEVESLQLAGAVGQPG